MIIEYDSKYDEEIKDLLLELQEHITDIDQEKYNIVTPDFRENCFDKLKTEVSENEGKIYLYYSDNKVIGLIVAIINNEKEESYDFKCPKRGRVIELVVSKNNRNSGIGYKLLHHMESYLKMAGCEDVLIGVFGYNDKAINFYTKSGYHTRMIEMTKKLDEKTIYE